MELICACGGCDSCRARDHLSVSHLSDEEYICLFGKSSWMRRNYEPPKKVKTPEEELKWAIFWVNTLQQTEKLGQQLKKHQAELKGREVK